ncbi:hypothetical protein [Legionella drozanskii]|uniref:Uncharacterized protein n=1 Tax=Legionella drozanskii LLAP-1 TaxID=1212489 RepID=A0A0W0SQY4_9GAMM|nr:hypothetical protein [Legionella drozanskii]KTC85807.1 hypothetical protein Ldro_2132 [Legionella drozanskii LLAP-1]
MFKPLENSITPVNRAVFLKFIENDAPFYSKLELYDNDDLVSDCSFKPQERSQIKENLSSFESLMNALKELNNEINSVHLGKFIELIESYNENPQNRPFT